MQIGILFITFAAFFGLVVSGKVKIHVAAMLIPIVLEITGVLKFEEAWGGLTNSSVIMMASMFVVAAGLNKTDLVANLSKAVIRPGASDIKILFGLMIPAVFLGSVVNGSASMAILIPIVYQVCAEHKRPVSKFMHPIMILSSMWAGFIPTGGNAGSYLASNTIVEKLGGVGTFTYFTNFILKVPSVIIICILVFVVGLKFAPDNGNIPTLGTEKAKNDGRSGQEGKRAEKELTAVQQQLAKIIFIGTVAGIVVCALTKVNTWYPSVIGAMLMVLLGILSDREAIRAMGNPVIFIFVGTLPMANALKITGADVMMANAFQKLTGNMSPILVMICMYVICMVMTQFLTNSVVSNTFKMLAAVIAVQSGYDPRALMLAVQAGVGNCFALPTAAPPITMAYEAGGYTLKQHFKQGIVYSVAQFLIFIIWVPLVFPLIPG